MQDDQALWVDHPLAVLIGPAGWSSIELLLRPLLEAARGTLACGEAGPGPGCAVRRQSARACRTATRRTRPWPSRRALLKAAVLEVGELYVLTEHEERFNPSDPQLRKRLVYWTNGTNRHVGNGYWRRFGWDSDALRKRPSWPGEARAPLRRPTSGC